MSSNTSPPKPWESATPGVQSTSVPAQDSPPELPLRPSTLNRPGFGASNQYPSGAYAGAGYGNSGYGNGYGSGAYGNSGYNGGMSRFGSGGYSGGYGSGGYGSSMYGSGMGGYGSGMGGYGNNRMGMYGQQRIGPNGIPYNEGDMSLSQRLEQSSQSTFQVLDNIVQAFGGFSQMLERFLLILIYSTFFATHSSFMAMMGVADQFGQLRGYLGQVLSILSVYNSAKQLYYKITGQQPPIDPSQLTASAFEEAQKPKPSKRPLLIFFAMIIGLPWLISKLMSHLEKNKSNIVSPPGGISNQGPSDIINLEFCKAKYDFNSENPQDLAFRRNDLIAILSKLEPGSEWWRGRTQEGRVGLFPNSYVSLIPKKEPAAPVVVPSINLETAYQQASHS